MARRKSYNPFKMWGSYVGAIASIIYFYFSSAHQLFDVRDILIRIYPYGLSPLTGGYITATWLTLVLGFLIGWGIHSIFRKLRKR